MVRSLTRCGGAVMTTAANTKDLRVIHPIRRNRRPGGRKFVMAGLTDITGVDVLRGFTGGGGTVMATHAIIDKTGMIRRIDGTQPTHGTVAGIAFCRGYQVIGTLTGRNNTIVATAANADDLGMVHPIRRHRLPGCRKLIMTCITGIGACYMRKTLTAGIEAVMATDAIINVIGMVRSTTGPGKPAGGGMTRVALRRGEDMIDAFTGCDLTVVTTAANTDDL